MVPQSDPSANREVGETRGRGGYSSTGSFGRHSPQGGSESLVLASKAPTVMVRIMALFSP
jgi:hypothetical protein